MPAILVKLNGITSSLEKWVIIAHKYPTNGSMHTNKVRNVICLSDTHNTVTNMEILFLLFVIAPQPAKRHLSAGLEVELIHGVELGLSGLDLLAVDFHVGSGGCTVTFNGDLVFGVRGWFQVIQEVFHANNLDLGVAFISVNATLHQTAVGMGVNTGSDSNIVKA